MLIERWEQIGAKLLALAQAFPEDKYDTAPVSGTRTFAAVLRHVAFWNNYVAEKTNGRETDDSANELCSETYATKEQIVAALRKATDDAAAALRAHSEDLDAALVESFIEHVCEHYGQLVVYARWAGIVPPASQS